jgi:hypothetical protein
VEQTFTPTRDEIWRAAALQGWHRAVGRARDWEVT